MSPSRPIPTPPTRSGRRSRRSGLRPWLAVLPFLALVVLGLAAGGCFALRPAVAPIPTLDLAQGPEGTDCLLVLLPGRGDNPTDFLREDFAGIALRNGVAADVVAVHSHMGYFRERTIIDRLHEDVIGPARERGQRVWLAGISLGGLASLLYIADHPGAVEGVVLLSPFLGDGPALREVAAAASLEDWEPSRMPEGRPLGDDVWFRLWDRIRGLTDGEPGTGVEDAPRTTDPLLYLAYGTGDRLAASHHLLARELPEDHVFTVDGGHDWDTWDELWDRLTAAGVPVCAPGAGATPGA